MIDESLQIAGFISQIAPSIIRRAYMHGYHCCSITIAQAMAETAAGTTSAAQIDRNFFGIHGKAGREQYNCEEECAEAYYRILDEKEDELLKDMYNYKNYAKELTFTGVSRSTVYEAMLCRLVEIYGLTAYDNVLQSFYDE